MDDLTIDRQKVLDDAVYGEVRRLQREGKLSLNVWTNTAIPTKSWSVPNFVRLLDSSRSTQPIPGGSLNDQQFVETLKQHLKAYEGDEDFAYHGALSRDAARRGRRVRPGHGTTDEEVSVGYGFNLNRPGAQEFTAKALGWDSARFDAVRDGRAPVTQTEKERLLEATIQETLAQLQQETKGRALPMHKRLVLASRIYNSGIGAVRDSGIIQDALNGDRETVVSKLRGRAASTPLDGLRRRFNEEARLYAGILDTKDQPPPIAPTKPIRTERTRDSASASLSTR
jgi:GH24 family phage-related lysozyme (muramidase)